MVLQREMMTEF